MKKPKSERQANTTEEKIPAFKKPKRIDANPSFSITRKLSVPLKPRMIAIATPRKLAKIDASVAAEPKSPSVALGNGRPTHHQIASAQRLASHGHDRSKISAGDKGFIRNCRSNATHH